MFDFCISAADTLWEKLRTETRPIILYGTGNGADKIIDQLQSIGRTPDGVFASSGFVRSRTFRDMPVCSYEDILSRFGEDIVILIAFGSPLPEVIERMRALCARHTVYIPEVPLIGGEVFTHEYYLAHREEIAASFSLLADDTSRALFYDMLLYRLTGEMNHLARTEESAVSLATLFNTEKIRSAVDGGAFTGDSAAVMLNAFPHLSRLIAVEPDPRTFKKLSAFAAESGGRVTPVHAALWDTPGALSYSASASRGAGASGKNRRARVESVPTETVDRLCGDTPIDLIKLDVEGAEARAIGGAAAVIRRDAPALSVSLYHRTEDLFTIPLMLSSLCPHHKFFLRRVPCIPAWDLMLYAIPVGLCRD